MHGVRLMEALCYQDIPVDEAADAIGLRPEELLARMFGVKEFCLEEIQRIKALLGLTNEEVDEIFFE